MSSTSKRLLAAVLCVLMTLGLFVPAGAAPAILGGEYAVEEVLLGDDDAVVAQPAAAGDIVMADERPVAVDQDEEVKLAEAGSCTCSPSAPHSGGSTIEYPAQGTEHYVDWAQGSTYTIKVATTDTLRNLKRDEGFSNNGGIDDTNKTIGIKCDSKTKVGINANIHFDTRTSDNKTTTHTILFHLVDPNACAHEWGEGKVTKQATCTAAGETTYICSKCNETKTEEIPALAHNWNDGVETTAPTCYQKGVKTYTCSVGGETRTEDIAATGAHTYGSDGKCTTTGCTAVNPEMCSHTMTTVAHKDANCTEDGVQGGQYCTICGQGEAAAKTVLKATGHDWKADGTCANGCGEVKNTSFLAAAGDLESAYALWPIDSSVSKYEAYIIDSANKETQVDDQLIRQYSNYMRVDVLGLKAGSYKIKVKDNKGGEMTTGTLSVKAHERTGYAFEGGNIPGAYKMDGTLKDGARVLYITNENKDAVKLSVLTGKNEEERTGLMDIIGAYSKKKETRPLVIRFVGMINPPSGLDKGACYVQGGNSITFEGVGNDATMKGWGFLIKDSTNVEVRNIGFVNSAGGDGDCVSIEQRNDHIWLHNCDFFYATAGSDSDQSKGDGSLDVKETTYGTFSYNHFWDCGKTSLVGMKDNVDYLTYHHNWFDHSDSRHPRVRYSQHIHIYNNYFDGVCKYGPGSSEGASLFVEANYFRNTRFPMISGMMAHDIKTDGKGILSNELGGVIKAYGNVIVGAEGFTSYQENPTDFDAYVATSRGEVIPGTVKAKGGTYSNFDTKSDFYKYTPESAEAAMVTTTKWAGRVQGGDFQWEFDNATQDYPAGEASAAAVIPELKAAVVGYKGTMVKVGGTLDSSATVEEHKHTPGTWQVTTSPTCTVDGEETQYCATCNDPINTRKVPAAHSNDGQGKCAVCGETIANSGGAASSASSGGKMLKHDQFIMTAPLTDSGKKSALAENEVEDATEGYFHVTGNVVKRNGNGGSDADIVGTKAEFFELPKSNTSGFSFTVTYVPAKVTVAWGTPKDAQKATLAIVKDGTALSTETKGGKSFSTTLDLTAAGTYLVTSAESSEYGARVFSITVTETEPPCEHDGTKTHHAAVAATCTKDGSEEYWTCNSCKKNFADEACTKPITDITVESTGHDWGDWVVSTDGKTQTRTCPVCKTTETEDVNSGDDEPDPPVPVNTKGLEAAITAAEKLTAVKVDTAAANVDKGTSWVTKSVMDALKSAIATAKALDTATADQDAVDAAAKALNDAVATFVDAVQEGAKESGGTSTGSVHTFESKTLTEAAAGSTASGAYKDDSYFTLVPSSKTKYDQSSKQWGESFGDNAYDPSGDNAASKVVRFNMGGASTKDGPGIKFTTAADNAKVQIWWAQNSGDSQDKTTQEWTAGNTIYQIALLKASDASKVDASKLAHTGSTPGGEGRVKKNDPEYTELTAPTAGEYMVGSLDGSVYIFKIVVTEGASGSTTPTVDKSALTKAIEDATAAIAVPTVSKDGKDVDPTAKWVTQAEKDTFQAAINAAKADKLTAASAADVTAAVNTLKAAAAAFETAQANGTKGQSGTAVTKITISGSGTVTVGSTITLTATVKPDDAANKAVTWTSSNQSVATVDANGKVTGVSAGTATITATAKDGSGVKDTWNVSVSSNGGGGGNSRPSGGGGGGGSTPTPTDPTPTTPAMGFVDVKSGDWFYDAVDKAFNKGLMKGIDATHFAPDATTTRAMVMTILARLNGKDTEGGETWYTKGMAWAVEAGISDGTAPLSQVTREQLAVMLFRYANPTVLDKSDALGQFTDADSISDWAVEALQWAVKVGVINGKGNGTVDPQGPATRSQVCAMVIRFIELDK